MLRLIKYIIEHHIATFSLHNHKPKVEQLLWYQVEIYNLHDRHLSNVNVDRSRNYFLPDIKQSVWEHKAGLNASEAFCYSLSS